MLLQLLLIIWPDSTDNTNEDQLILLLLPTTDSANFHDRDVNTVKGSKENGTCHQPSQRVWTLKLPDEAEPKVVSREKHIVTGRLDGAMHKLSPSPPQKTSKQEILH